MLFKSLAFLVFSPLVTAAFFLLPHRFRWFLLLASSAYFYMAFIPRYILILGFTIVLDYVAGLLIARSRGRRRAAFLILSLAGNLGVLALFKYADFLGGNLSALSGIPIRH